MYDALAVRTAPRPLAAMPATARCRYRDARRLLHAEAVDDWEASCQRPTRLA